MRTLLSVRSLLLALMMLAFSASSFAQIRVGISVTIAPPELPVYQQPLCPGDGYIWTPGYWAWGDDDYYWVPGTWVLAPEVGFFWTPGYWGWGGSSFIFYEGYWGPVVGFYGGINYGFGYFGHGYEGGRWDNGHFFYNRSVSNVNITEIHNVYNERVVNNVTTVRVSYNGGNGGINARATAQEEAAARERHIPPVATQVQHVQAARADQSLRASVNHGMPPVAATPKPGAFNDRGIVRATEGGHYNPPAHSENNAARPENNAARPSTAFHPNELPPATRPAAPNTGDAKIDQKYQKQQDKLMQQQGKERQQLQQKQEQEHQQLAKQKADDARKQQVEQKHQQQTQQLAQRHAQQQQQLQQRQQPPTPHQSGAKPPK
jgi:hypothetical protein